MLNSSLPLRFWSAPSPIIFIILQSVSLMWTSLPKIKSTIKLCLVS